MSIDQYRNISFSAYIEYDFLDCTGKFAENVLRIFPRFMLIYFSPCGLCSRSLCTSLCCCETRTFLAHKVKKKSVNLGTLPVFNFYHQTPCPIYLSGNMKEFIWKKEISKSEESVQKCEGFLKKNEQLYGKMLSLTEKVKKIYGKNIEK